MNSKNAYKFIRMYVHVCSNVNIRVINEFERFIIKKQPKILFLIFCLHQFREKIFKKQILFKNTADVS